MQLELLTNKDVGDRVKNAISSGQVPAVYANGFIIFIGQSDVGLILQTNGKEVCVLNMSYTMAKTMVEKLGITVRDFEAKTGNVIMTTDFIQQKMKEHAPPTGSQQKKREGN